MTIGFFRSRQDDVFVYKMMDCLPDPLAVISPDGTIRHANAAMLELAGNSSGPLMGRDAREVPILSKALDLLLSSPSGPHGMFRHWHGSFAYEVTLSPVDCENPEDGILVLAKDVTKFTSMESELLRRNRELVASNALAGTFISSDDIEGVFGELLEKALALTELTVGWIMLSEEGQLRTETVRGASMALRKSLMEGSGLDDFHARILKSPDPMEVMDSSDKGLPPELAADSISFLVSIPLVSHGESLGAVVLANRLDVEMDFDLASLLSVTGNIISLLADKIRLFRETRRLSITDALTGLYNTRYFYEILSMEAERTRRYGESFSLILYDIDNFKKLNDTYGHQAGDEVLRDLSAILMRASRKTDTVARYGGEEFIIILPETLKDMAASHALRIKDEVASHVFLKGEGGVRLSLSGGVSACPEDATTDKGLLYCADRAMYTAKQQGKDRVTKYIKELVDDQ